MAEIMDTLVALLLSRYGAAVAIGLVISWSGTQWVKKLAHVNGKNAMVLAFVFAAFPTLALWPNLSMLGLFTAIAVGFSSPIAYKVFVVILKKRRPDLAQIFSGDRK